MESLIFSYNFLKITMVFTFLAMGVTDYDLNTNGKEKLR